MNKTKPLFPKAILFDMDGVLIDSLDAWWKAINVALEYANHSTISKNDFIEHIWGNDFEESMNYLGIKEDIFSINNQWVKVYLNQIIISENAAKILSNLYRTYPLGIITNTQQRITNLVLKKFNISSFFSTIVCADDVKKGKPNPDIIIRACKHLNVPISQVIVIGDTDKDLLACRKAGCIMIGMNYKKAAYNITNLSEIPLVLSQISKALHVN